MGCGASAEAREKYVVAGEEEIPLERATSQKNISWKRKSTDPTADIQMKQQQHASKRGINLALVDSNMRAYFADVAILQYFVITSPELLLLPWEYMRAMGVLQLRDPRRTDYTFLSHQWQLPVHPFPDMKQLTEHLDRVSTRFLWLDWFCVPQWSRDWSAVSQSIFAQTMVSFHSLCFNAADALVVLKRRDSGITMAEEDLGAVLVLEAEAAQQTFEAAGLKTTHAPLPSITSRICEVGLDLEYAIRAWCALEKTYLPNTSHKDVRLVQLIKHLSELRLGCESSISALMRSSRASKNTSDVRDNEAPSRLLAKIERINAIISLCQASPLNRRLYQNAWSYQYLKRRVLRISNPSDYRYLDNLFVTETSLGDNGILYIRSVQRQARITSFVPKLVDDIEEDRNEKISPSEEMARHAAAAIAATEEGTELTQTTCFVDGKDPAEDDLRMETFEDGEVGSFSLRNPMGGANGDGNDADDEGDADWADTNFGKQQVSLYQLVSGQFRSDASESPHANGDSGRKEVAGRNGDSKASQDSNRSSRYTIAGGSSFTKFTKSKLLSKAQSDRLQRWTVNQAGTPSDVELMPDDDGNDDDIGDVPELHPGAMVVRFDGKLLIQVLRNDEALKELQIRVSDMGVLGAHPVKEKILLRWRGTPSAVTHFQAVVVERLEICHQDVRQHQMATRMTRLA